MSNTSPKAWKLCKDHRFWQWTVLDNGLGSLKEFLIKNLHVTVDLDSSKAFRAKTLKHETFANPWKVKKLCEIIDSDPRAKTQRQTFPNPRNLKKIRETIDSGVYRESLKIGQNYVKTQIQVFQRLPEQENCVKPSILVPPILKNWKNYVKRSMWVTVLLRVKKSCENIVLGAF